MAGFSSFFDELKRRNVFRVGAAYVVVAWLVAQALELIFDSFGTPGWVMKTVLVLLAVGLLFALFFAWAFELTPEGLKKEKEVDRTESITQQTGRKLDFLIIGVLVVAVGLLVLDNYVWVQDLETTASTETASLEQSERKESTSSKESGAGAAIPSIAVLPFNNMSSDAEQEYIADGLTEDLITDLSQSWAGLRVVARTSTFAYKGQSPDIRQVGKELGARYIVEGSVRRIGDRIRVTAQLIEAETGEHLWAEKFDRPWAEFFEVQDELIRGIVYALGYELQEAEMTRAQRAEDPSALDAWELSARAWNLYARADTNIKEILQLQRRALELQPDWAWLHISLANFIGGNVFAGESDNPEADLAEVWEHGRQAVALAPDDPMVLSLWGLIHERFGTPKEAIRILEHVRELAPNFPMVFQVMAMSYTRVGRPRKAIEMAGEHLRLDPMNPETWVDHLIISICHMQLSQYAEAEVASRRAIRGNSSSALVWPQLAIVLVAQGRIEEAQAAMTETRALDPNYTMVNFESVFLPYYPDQAEQVMTWARQAWGEH